MNSGILDAHNLAFRIAEGLTPESLREYSEERSSAVAENIKIANSLYGRSLEIARTLGLDVRAMDLLERLVSPMKSLPFAKSLFDAAVKLGSLHLESDYISASLSEALKRKNLHLPMVLLDHEFQMKIETKHSTLYLLPNAQVRVVSLSGQAGEAPRAVSLPLRKLAGALAAPHFRQTVSLAQPGCPGASISALDCPEDQLEAACAGLGAEARPRHFISRPRLLQILQSSPHLSGVCKESCLTVRKDGYLEARK